MFVKLIFNLKEILRYNSNLIQIKNFKVHFFILNCLNTNPCAGYYEKGHTNPSCVFVNEVLRSQKPQTFWHPDKDEMKDVDITPQHPFEKHFFWGCPETEENDYRVDALGRRYRNVENDCDSRDAEYLADESIVVPRYLIEISWAHRRG